jgi:hypothetical protein
MDSDHFKISEDAIGWFRKHKREDAALYVTICIEHDESVTVEDPATEWPAVVELRFSADGASWSDQIGHFVVKHEAGPEELSLEEEIARDVIVMYEKNRHHAEDAVRLLNKLGIPALRTP